MYEESERNTSLHTILLSSVILNLTEAEMWKVQSDHIFSFSLDKRLLQLSGGQNVLITMTMDGCCPIEDEEVIHIFKNHKDIMKLI